MDRVHSLLTWYPEPVSRFTSLPLQASPASLPPASAPALLLPCAAALVRALVRAPPHPSARRRDPRLLLLFRAVAPVRRGPRLPACRRSCWCCPAVGRPRVRVRSLRPAAAWPRPPVDAATPLAAACCPSPRRGAALWLKPPLLCFARRGPLLCSAFFWNRGAALLCFFFSWSRGEPPLVLFAL